MRFLGLDRSQKAGWGPTPSFSGRAPGKRVTGDAAGQDRGPRHALGAVYAPARSRGRNTAPVSLSAAEGPERLERRGHVDGIKGSPCGYCMDQGQRPR